MVLLEWRKVESLPLSGIPIQLAQTGLNNNSWREYGLSRLFDPIRIGNLQLKNRIVMAPMESHLGNADGSVSTEQIA